MSTIVCEGLTKRYGSVQALKGINLTVTGKGCVGFLGPNGAGKTTTIRILTGLAHPSGGRATVDGMDVVRERDRVRSRIGYLAQSPAFYNYMGGQEFLLFVGELFGMESRAARLRSEELLKLLGLWDARRRAIGGYSGGMKQRLGLAQALMNKPSILFLDEPVSALDPVGRHEILELIEQLKAETTIFMSSHVLGDVERVADQVVIINEGTVAVEASMQQLRAEYATPVYTVEVDNPSADFADALKRLPYVSGVRREGALYRVTVKDLQAARQNLARQVLDTGAVLLQFGTEAPTLEDIFLKVVGEP
ncbi:MAG: ATP-binding cassette domain-containing protein [Mycobacterium leprae]